MVAPIFYPFPDEVRRHPAYRRVFSRLTLAVRVTRAKQQQASAEQRAN
jgi:hypothetical protein